MTLDKITLIGTLVVFTCIFAFLTIAFAPNSIRADEECIGQECECLDRECEITPTPTPTPTDAPKGGPGDGKSDGRSSASSEPPVCTDTPPEKAPVNLNIRSHTDTSVTLAWWPVEPTSHYIIRYGIEPGNYPFGMSNIGNVTQYTVNELDLNTTYYFEVAAVNGCMVGPWAGPVSVEPTVFVPHPQVLGKGAELGVDRASVLNPDEYVEEPDSMETFTLEGSKKADKESGSLWNSIKNFFSGGENSENN